MSNSPLGLFAYPWDIIDEGEDAVIDAVKTISQYRNKKTGAIYKTKEEWEKLGIPNEDIAQDLTVIMPPLDLLGKTS